ncbi:MAG: hypothetical protein ABSG71_20045, partial [Thermodesulfobacteriota bacterium]
ESLREVEMRPLKKGYAFSEADSVLGNDISPVLSGRTRGLDIFSGKSATRSKLVECFFNEGQ